MKRWIMWGSLFCMIAAVGFAADNNPFVGTWSLNQAKSNLSGETMKFSPAGNGMIRETVAEGSYTFKPDGKSYPSLFGETENWQALSDHSWKVAIHGNGGYTYSETLNVSADGKSLKTTIDGSSPDGSAYHETAVYTKVAGGNGLMGTWKSTAVKRSSPGKLEFSAYGDDGLTWKLPQIKAVLNAKFDGKDYAPDGPTVPKGLTIALTKAGPNSFWVNEKMNGKTIYKGKYTVSANGKTMTAVGKPPSQAQMERSVYDKE